MHEKYNFKENTHLTYDINYLQTLLLEIINKSVVDKMFA